jgi:predicted transcriptional regulator|tara:strand:+ start:85 stop:429 length:345 start_codon:yes stop_codon:yes gene_type:complete
MELKNRTVKNKMTEEETISWIFLSIAFASETKTADLKEISNIADGINHSIPNQKELKNSIHWLLEKKLIEQNGKKYKLSKSGIIEFKETSEKTNVISKIWKNLELRIKGIIENN